MFTAIKNTFKTWARSILDDPNARPTWEEIFQDSTPSASGESVSLLRAIGYPAFRQGVTLLSGDVAKLRFAPYRLSPDGSCFVDREHSAYRVTAWMASPSQGAFTFWRHMMIHAIIYTHAYAWIRRDGKGRPLELIPLLSDRTTKDGELYLSEIDGNLEAFTESEIFHLRGMCFGDGDDCELLADCRDTIGLGIAANNFASRFFKNGGRMGGVLELPAAMRTTARDKLEEGWRKTYESKEAQFRTVILRDNAKFHAAQFDPDKGQMTLSRQEQVKETARVLNIPAHKLGHDGRTAYNSLEMEERSYNNSSISHWTKALADEANVKLLSTAEQAAMSHEFSHDLSELIATDSKTRADIAAIEIDRGIKSPNDIRREMKLPPREGGDTYAGGTSDTTDPEAEPPAIETNSRLSEAIETVLADSIDRAAEAIRQSVRREVKRKKLPAFLTWFDERMDTYCGRAFRETIAGPANAAALLRGVDPDNLVDNLAETHIGHVRRTVNTILNTSTESTIVDDIIEVMKGDGD